VQKNYTMPRELNKWRFIFYIFVKVREEARRKVCVCRKHSEVNNNNPGYITTLGKKNENPLILSNDSYGGKFLRES